MCIFSFVVLIIIKQLFMARYWFPFCVEIFVFHCLICDNDLESDKKRVGTYLLVFPSRSALCHGSPRDLCLLVFVTWDEES